MSKSVLLSIKPKYCELIASGKKTIEVRKTKPKLDTPFKCYIYCTKDFYRAGDGYFQGKYCGKVIGEFVCDEITYLGNISTDPWCSLLGDVHEWHKRLVTKGACLTEEELLKYGGKNGWHISDLIIYDEPKELKEFIRICPEWEKEEITEKCLECEHLYRSPIEHFIECDYEGELPITRPPQSWCYAEELR